MPMVSESFGTVLQVGKVPIIEHPNKSAASAACEDEAVTPSKNQASDWATHVTARSAGSSHCSECLSNAHDDAPFLPFLESTTGSGKARHLVLVAARCTSLFVIRDCGNGLSQEWNAMRGPQKDRLPLSGATIQ